MVRPKTATPDFATPDEIEQQFYEALRRGDIEGLMALWSDDEEISCVHPGGPRLIGAVAIRAAFESIFSNGVVNAQAERVRRLQSHSCAVHSVVEHVRVMTEQGPQSGWVLATNVFLLTTQGWRLVSHHASPGSSRQAMESDEPATVLH